MAHEGEGCEEDIENLNRLIGLKDVQFSVISARCTPGSSSGDNYMSVVKRIVLNGKDADARETSMSLIVKRQIPSHSRRQLYRCDEAFNNEIAAYNHVLPLLSRFISPEPYFPKCYFAGKDDTGELIVLEDLKPQNFKMLSRLQGLDFEHCQLVMKELAKFHAASIAAKRADFTEFRLKVNSLKDIVYCDDAQQFYHNVLGSAVEEALDSLRESNTDGSLTKAIQYLENMQPVLYSKLKELILKQTGSNIVVCHGDLWINNMMFQTDQVTGKPVAVRFFDLQAMRYSSPIFDILHFLYTSTRRATRDAYLNEILETYCQALMEHIDSHHYPDSQKDLDEIKDAFTIRKIKQEIKEKHLYGLAIAAWILPAVTFDPQNIPNLDLLSETASRDGRELKCTQKLTPEYHTRIKEIMLEFQQMGLFNVPE